MSDDKWLSHKMKVLSVIAMIMVILIHSITVLGIEDSLPTWCVFMQYLVLRSFTYAAVPFFFAASGFWLVRGHFSYAKKIRSLLIPYLGWACIGGVAVLPLIVGNNYLGHKPLLARSFLEGGNLAGMVDRLWGVCRLGPVGDEPLWYVRNLLLIFLIAPAIKWLAGKKLGCLMLLVVWALLSLGFCTIPIPIYLDSVGFGWFCFGVAMASLGMESRSVPTWMWLTSAVVWFACSIMKCASAVGFLVGYGRFDVLIPVGGIVFLWGLYDRWGYAQTWIPPACLKDTFWIYCIHIIFGGYIMGVSLFLLGKGAIAVTIIAMYTPIIMLGLSFGAAILCRRIWPKLFDILNGGRSK